MPCLQGSVPDESRRDIRVAVAAWLNATMFAEYPKGRYANTAFPRKFALHVLENDSKDELLDMLSRTFLSVGAEAAKQARKKVAKDSEAHLGLKPGCVIVVGAIHTPVVAPSPSCCCMRSPTHEPRLILAPGMKIEHFSTIHCRRRQLGEGAVPPGYGRQHGGPRPKCTGTID